MRCELRVMNIQVERKSISLDLSGIRGLLQPRNVQHTTQHTCRSDRGAKSAWLCGTTARRTARLSRRRTVFRRSHWTIVLCVVRKNQKSKFSRCCCSRTALRVQFVPFALTIRVLRMRAYSADPLSGFEALGTEAGVILKSDGEPAILALKAKLTEHVSEDGALAVEPPPNGSQSTGRVENAVKLFKGVIRVHLLALERKTEACFPSLHRVIPWLIQHVPNVISKYLTGSDGRTSYERLFGKHLHEACLSSESLSCGARGAQQMRMLYLTREGGLRGYG
jgi:hypothetical protein